MTFKKASYIIDIDKKGDQMSDIKLEDVLIELNDLRARTTDLENQAVVFNNVIISLAMLANVKPNGFKYITPEEYKDYTLNSMQKFAKAVMDVSQKANVLIQEEQEAKNAASKDSDKKDSTKKAD